MTPFISIPLAGSAIALYTDRIFLSPEVEELGKPGEGLLLLRDPPCEEDRDNVPLSKVRAGRDRTVHELQGPERALQVPRMRVHRSVRCFDWVKSASNTGSCQRTSTWTLTSSRRASRRPSLKAQR